MKSALYTLLALALPFSAGADTALAPAGSDLGGAVMLYIPEDDVNYDYGGGMEGRLRLWLTPMIGLGASLGIAEWEVNEQSSIVSDGTATLSADIDGSTALIPLGLSLYVRPRIADNVSLTIEGGVRYVVVESDVEGRLLLTQSTGSVSGIRDELKFDDGITAFAGVDLEIDMGSGVSLFGGVGYIADIDKGDIEFQGVTTGEHQLESLTFRGGLSLRL